MKTFENYTTQLNINSFTVSFSLFHSEDKYDLFYYEDDYKSRFSDWLFFYNKKYHIVGVNIKEYRKLNTGISFEDYIKPFNFIYDHIEFF